MEINKRTEIKPYGLDAVLSHKFPDGLEHPIAFTSQTLLAAECKYSQIEKETLASLYGIIRYPISIFMVVVFVASLSHQEMSQLELSRTIDITTTPTIYINSYIAKAALTKDANESQ